jgi:hypothetical protein
MRLDLTDKVRSSSELAEMESVSCRWGSQTFTMSTIYTNNYVLFYYNSTTCFDTYGVISRPFYKISTHVTGCKFTEILSCKPYRLGIFW